MTGPAMIKTAGYLVSTISVILLGIVSWKSVEDHPWLAACLLGGMGASILGMGLRWVSYQLEEHRDQAQKAPKTRSAAATRSAARSVH